MKCKQCNEELIDKREGALYCNHNCQQKYFKRKKRIKLKVARLERNQSFNQQFILELEEKLKSGRKILEEKLKGISQKLRIPHLEFKEFKRVLELSLAEFRRELFEAITVNPEKYYHAFEIINFGTHFEKENLVEQFRQSFREQIASVRKKCLNLVKQRKEVVKLLNGFDEGVIRRKIGKIRLEHDSICKELIELRGIDLDRLPLVPSMKTKSNGKSIRTSSARAYSGREILKMEFNGLKLNGELGKFLGKLQRERCAIALTGDSGAGKSTFSYQIANGFLEKNQTVAYFSLEAGFTESMQQIIEKYGIDKYKFSAFAEGSLKDVRTEANNFDCVIIDSFSKISTRAEDFESLRQDFPNTFFVIIFQRQRMVKFVGGHPFCLIAQRQLIFV